MLEVLALGESVDEVQAHRMYPDQDFARTCNRPRQILQAIGGSAALRSIACPDFQLPDLTKELAEELFSAHAMMRSHI